MKKLKTMPEESYSRRKGPQGSKYDFLLDENPYLFERGDDFGDGCGLQNKESLRTAVTSWAKVRGVRIKTRSTETGLAVQVLGKR